MLEAAREKRMFSQGAAAEASKLSRDYWRRIEKDGVVPTLAVMVDIRNGLKLTQDEWDPLLGRFLVESGAATASSTPTLNRLLDEVNQVASADSEKRMQWLKRTATNMLRMTDEQMDLFTGLSAFMLRYPTFFAAAQSMMDLEAGVLEPSPDSTIPEHPAVREPRGEPSDPVMANLKRKQEFSRRQAEVAAHDIRSRQTNPDSTTPKVQAEAPGQPSEPVMAKLVKKKAAEKAAKS